MDFAKHGALLTEEVPPRRVYGFIHGNMAFVRVAQALGEHLGLPEVGKDLPELAERQEREPEVEPNIDRRLGFGATLRQTREGRQRLLEIRHRLAMRGARGRSRRSLTEVADRVAPQRSA